MHEQLSALADPARWRLVQVLAERPRSVGIVGELTGLRQPQASKHLQTLERAGLVVARRSGHRRIYALKIEALRSVIEGLEQIASIADTNSGAREAFDRYAAAVELEVSAADRERWADEREYVFSRQLTAPRDAVWQYLTDPALLTRWWATDDLRLAHIEFGTQPGDRLVQEYADVDDLARSDGTIGRAEGVIDAAQPAEHLAFRLSPVLPDGRIAFAAHYTYSLSDASEGTDLEVRLRISDSTVPSAEFIAGITLGWNQCLDKLTAILAGNTDTRKEER